MTSKRSKQFLLKTLGQRIKNLRKEKNMSQYVVAKKCNMDFGSYSNIENGKRNVTLTPAQKSRLFWLTIIGVVLFSGSIYLLSTNTLTPIDFGFFGPITPIGGLFLISAWGVLFYHTLKNKF